MPQVEFRSGSGTSWRVEAELGSSLLTVALGAGVPGIIGDCGGQMNCGTCHVYVDEPFFARLPAPGEEEAAMLADGVGDPRTASRLSCQIVIDDDLDGLSVEVAPQF